MTHPQLFFELQGPIRMIHFGIYSYLEDTERTIVTTDVLQCSSCQLSNPFWQVAAANEAGQSAWSTLKASLELTQFIDDFVDPFFENPTKPACHITFRMVTAWIYLDIDVGWGVLLGFCTFLSSLPRRSL